MNEEEIKSLIEQLKATGLKDEEIMDTFYKSFEKGEMDRDDLETLANAMGYELTDDFKNDAEPDPIANGGDAGEMSKEQLEDAQALKPGESAEEFKDRVDGESNAEGDGEENPEGSGEEETADDGEGDSDSDSDSDDEDEDED